MTSSDLRHSALAWTLAALAFATLPHVPGFPAWITASLVVGILWRLVAERRHWSLPPRWLRLLLALFATVAVLAAYRTLNGLEAGTALLALMAAMKLLETRSSRDQSVLIFIGYFLSFAGVLISQTPPRLIWGMVALWFLTAALARVVRPPNATGELPALSLGARAFIYGLPLALLLFLFVPRIEGRFWALPADERAVTGISDEMSPGDISELSLLSTPAFRARFSGPLPPPSRRYWRGPVLHEFDGYTWRRGATRFLPRQAITFTGQPTDYRVLMEPTQRPWLFALDMVSAWPGIEAQQSWDFQLQSPRRVTAPLAYDARSYLNFRAGDTLPASIRQRALQLPPARNRRSLALAAELRQEAHDDRDYIRRVLNLFRTGGFRYTLKPPRLDLDSVDSFLFDSREGFCGHFASSFTMLMRAAGIPARVVTGYQGGEFNALGGYLIVRQSDAHAWSEVWLEGAGWTRVDPTAAVAPERIERSLAAALPDDDRVAGRVFLDYPWLQRARLAWDALNTTWQDEVVDYGTASQAALLERLGLGGRGWQGLALALLIGLAVIGVGLLAILALEFRRQPRDLLLRSWDTFCSRLAAIGVGRQQHEGPLAYAERVVSLRPDLAVPVRAIARQYARLRYLPGARPVDQQRLVAVVRHFRPARRRAEVA